MRTTVDPLYACLRALFWMLDTERMVLQLRWIPTHVNVVADRLSREEDVEDWSLRRDLFSGLDILFGLHCIDRFATAVNRLCLRYNSRWHDVGSEGDAFAATDWAASNNWANPLWTLLPRLVDYLASLPTVHATVLAPRWTGQPWFRRLHSMAWAMVPVARSPTTFLAGRTGHLPVGLPRWQIVAFRIDRPAPSPPLQVARRSRTWLRLARQHRLQWV
jgi:hypothetical protein